MPVSLAQRFLIRGPNGSIRGALYDDLQEAVTECAAVNATNDPGYAHVVVPVIHPTEV